MKRFLLSVVLVLTSLSFMVNVAEAKRFGGGGTSGMQRSMPSPSRAAPEPSPGYQAPPASPSATPGLGAGAAAAAAPARRSWMGPIAGLAAGLGIAALFSHFGMGEGLANFMMIALLALVAVFVIRFLVARFSGNRPMAYMNPGSYQNAGFGAAPAATAGTPAAMPALGAGGGFGGASAPAAAPTQRFAVPPGFDVPAFERAAKMIFIRMQAANDVGDLNDLRQFTTPELFASVRLDLQERNNAPQQTDVVKLDTEVLDIARENGNQVVSVRFHGLIREEVGASPAPFDEVWHLVKPEDGHREWAIAGIAQYA